MNSRILRIAVFDSGVGGLSVAKEILRLVPQCSLIYCCDNLHFPYGPKPESEVVEHVLTTVSELVERHSPDVLVIACNTASTVALPALRKHLTIPVVGVVPAIKPAAEQSKSKIIGLLATPGTIQRHYTEKLIHEFAPDCLVLRIGTSLLVEMAENKMRGRPVSLTELEREIEPLFNALSSKDGKQLDTVVLGCTHFPLLHPELEKAAKWPVRWIDSGEAIARRIFSFFPEPHAPHQENSRIALFSHMDEGVDQLQKHTLHAFGFKDIRKL